MNVNITIRASTYRSHHHVTVGYSLYSYNYTFVSNANYRCKLHLHKLYIT